jgi:serine/threonine protein kinase
LFHIRSVDGVTRYGIVRRCSPYSDPDKRVLVKTIHLDKLRKKSKDVMEELYLLKNIKHDQINSISKIYSEDEKFYVVTPDVKGKNLRYFMRSENRLTEAQVAFIVKQIFEIIKYVIFDSVKKRESSIFNSTDEILTKQIYRDIKIENFVIDSKTHYVTMIDYGVSSLFLNINDLKKHLRTPISVSPECIKSSYQPGCEVWSIGVITYQLLTSMDPYKGTDIGELFNNIITGDSRLLKKKWNHSKVAYDFINSTLGDQVNQPISHHLGVSSAKFKTFLLNG